MTTSASEESDRARWDRKYSAGLGPVHFRPNRLLTSHHYLVGGRALDLACGFGGNALYLASHGYRVDAIDASGVALEQAQRVARRRGLQLNLVQADLERWWFPASRYDVIAVFFYLNRLLLDSLAKSLTPGGMLFQAGRNIHYLRIRPEFNRAFLLEPGELEELAKGAGLDIIFCDDGDGSGHHASHLIARRPLPG